MAESHWPEIYSYIEIPKNTVLSQTINPLFSHEFQYLRLAFKGLTDDTKLHIKLRYALISGEPIGWPLLEWTYTPHDQPLPSPDRKSRFDSWGKEVVKTIYYAITIECLDCNPRYIPSVRFTPTTGGYPRGKLIKSEDSEGTWDFTDLGDLCFNEWGYPPLEPRNYAPPLDYWTIAQYHSLDYNTSSCIRIGSTTPSHLTILVSDRKPVPIERYRTVRGFSTLCLDHYTFYVSRSYPQLEKDDSLYHTFHVGRLKEGQPYWFAFTATADFWPIPSTGPIFHKIHPEAPPFTTIKRPNAPGDLCQIPYETANPCPDHYLNINEATPDEEASQIWTAAPWRGLWRQDLYRIPDLEPFDRPIEQVHFTVRVKYAGTRPPFAGYRFYIKTHGSIYGPTTYGDLELYYENRHWHSYLNPFTGLPWTRQEVNDLQIGVGLWHNTGVGWAVNSYCTQVYCKIIHDCSAYE